MFVPIVFSLHQPELHKNQSHCRQFHKTKLNTYKSNNFLNMSYLIELSFLTFLSPLPQPDLAVRVGLKIVMHDLEVLEGRENRIIRQRTLDEELEFPRVLEQSVSGVDAHLLAHCPDHASHFAFEIRRVVYDVEVRVADPCCRRVVVQFTRKFYAL